MLLSRYRGPPVRIKGIKSEMPGVPITSSVTQLAPNAWKLGELVICERATTLPPSTFNNPHSFVTCWRDDVDNLWYLRRGKKVEGNNRISIVGELLTPFHKSGTSGAIWKLGGMYVKVKSWTEGMDPEADTLKFVRGKCPDVPVPEVLASWIDTGLQRSYAVIRPMPGQILLHVWPTLSPHLRQLVVNQVAHFCSILAKSEATYMGSAVAPLNGVRDQYLCPERPVSIPSWKPISLPRIDEWNGQEYFNPFQIGRTFYLYHAELEPTNILVTSDGRVTAILDWECAGYYPRGWISTKPQISREFLLEGPGVDPTEWQRMLVTALEDRGFADDRVDWDEFRGRISGNVSTSVSFAKYFPSGIIPLLNDAPSSSSAPNGHPVESIESIETIESIESIENA